MGANAAVPTEDRQWLVLKYMSVLARVPKRVWRTDGIRHPTRRAEMLLGKWLHVTDNLDNAVIAKDVPWVASSTPMISFNSELALTTGHRRRISEDIEADEAGWHGTESR